jgi:hypothetical protein
VSNPKVAHLVLSGAMKRCSVCGYPFSINEEPALTRAFVEHIRKAHHAGQETEDVNQAAARIVREAAERS